MADQQKRKMHSIQFDILWATMSTLSHPLYFSVCPLVWCRPTKEYYTKNASATVILAATVKQQRWMNTKKKFFSETLITIIYLRQCLCISMCFPKMFHHNSTPPMLRIAWDSGTLCMSSSDENTSKIGCQEATKRWSKSTRVTESKPDVYTSHRQPYACVSVWVCVCYSWSNDIE